MKDSHFFETLKATTNSDGTLTRKPTITVGTN